VPSAIAALLRETPASPGKIEFVWNLVVGAAAERATTVRLDGRTLVVEAATPHWATEISRSSATILARIQALVGDDAVGRIVVNPSR
jgi:predicted nucleic acid-binding Zn ribbon protein